MPESNGAPALKVEFHCHSTFSDGFYSPERLADILAAARVRCAALTDHDTTAGLARFERALAEKRIGFVTGVEIEAGHALGMVHLLAYGFDPGHRGFQDTLASIRGQRELNPAAFREEAKSFLRWVTRRDTSMDASLVPVAEVIARVHEAGGLVFMAHPLALQQDPDALDALLGELAGQGLDGVEAYYKPYPKASQEVLVSLAAKHRLLVCPGSDFHGGTRGVLSDPALDFPVEHWERFRGALGLPEADEPFLVREPSLAEMRERDAAAGSSLGHLKSRHFSLRILLPTFLAMGLFIVSMFAEFIPTLRQDLMEDKKEMIRELTNSAWSVLTEFEQDERAGLLTRAEAQERAAARIEFLRYGEDGKDYFWITDMHPTMVMHPYRPDLNGQDLTDFEDHGGKRLFVELVKVVQKDGHGYMDYQWQWKDDSSRVVPKLSYVREFEPWGWIIGTGIYLEDVRQEIGLVARREVHISLAIIAIISVLLFYISQQSLKTERRRSQAEAELRESREKYRALVEASTEGTLMVADGRFVHCNKTILSMLGYTREEFLGLGVMDIFDGEAESPLGRTYFEAHLAGRPAPAQYEAHLRTKGGRPLEALLSASRLLVEGNEALIVTAKDISLQKQVAGELGETRERFKSLTDSISIGVFRTDTGAGGGIVEANPAAARILGLPDRKALLNRSFLDFFPDAEERAEYLKALSAGGELRDRIVRLKRDDGTTAVVSISAVTVQGGDGRPRYHDGVVEDITDRKKREEEREALIVDLQTSLLFLNEPIRDAVREVMTCDMNLPVRRSAALMTKDASSAFLVTAAGGEVIGIVTDHDLRERVIGASRDLDTPIFEVMSSPLISISDGALMFEAILQMQEHGIKHLAVRDPGNRVVGIIRGEELLGLHWHSSAFLAKEIREAGTIAEIVAIHEREPRLVKALIDSGAKARNITRVVTAVSDAITDRLVQFAIDELGPPPARFAFMALGSEGRAEQTLITDQDNAVVFEDGVDIESTQAYFLKLGERVCGWLNEAGYPFCDGDNMAKNPRWCQPLSKWKEHFASWIAIAEPENLLQFNIFFDFRAVYGETDLIRELRRHITGLMGQTPSFFLHFAQNTMLYKPPVGLFGQIVVESGGDKPRTFNIKDAIAPIVGFARIYALKNGLEETNTLDRLHRLVERNALKRATHDELVLAYDYLMQLRFKHQAAALSLRLRPDNRINPKELAEIEVMMLRQVFSQIGSFLKKISYDFLGVA
jgi:PAS domain S-box-containing protein